jgi:hypothetical protein
MTTIDLSIVPSSGAEPPMVRASLFPETPGGDRAIAEALKADTDEAMVARAMLSAAAYLFAKGLPVQFGPEIPVELLK